MMYFAALTQPSFLLGHKNHFRLLCLPLKYLFDISMALNVVESHMSKARASI